MRKRIRRHSLAEHFCVNIRTIDAWAKGALFRHRIISRVAKFHFGLSMKR